jgi:hypothetical protein
LPQQWERVTTFLVVFLSATPSFRHAGRSLSLQFEMKLPKAGRRATLSRPYVYRDVLLVVEGTQREDVPAS